MEESNPFLALPNKNSVIQQNTFRITLLTSRLVRFEFSKDDKFEDHASQVIIKRDLPTPEFSTAKIDPFLEISTKYLCIRYDTRENGPNGFGLNIFIKDINKIWNYGQEDSKNLKGTARTLDNADGSIELEPGLLSKEGWTIWDDSSSLIFNEQGWLENRPISSKPIKDFYFFGYGHDYLACLKEFSQISGKTPMIPRWALGNWWSRYWEYTQSDIERLVEEFQKRNIPISTFIIDMDWHITDISQYWKENGLNQEKRALIPKHDGWTGFTWNKKLFPDYKKLLNFIHDKKLHTALNLHPATGIYPHEIQFTVMKKEIGEDSTNQDPVLFDIANSLFAKSYFKHIIHPYERDGVDFWWMDWQQEKFSNLPGLDPLWWLNHLHFKDMKKNSKKRPMIFSRWGGMGNHRYPIGFSGDTKISWESLAFQPYFTSTASNVGYSWWSHDIGGHMNGHGDTELYVRWFQFGVFSPIFRLHSTKNTYIEKLPWNFNAEIYRIVKIFMQLRHALIPYIYTMAWRNYKEAIPLIQPLYYNHPENNNAYNYHSEYYFGSEMICSPFISPQDSSVGLARTDVWLPEGDWFDFFTGEYFCGNRTYSIYGTLEDIPIFVKAGGIIPLSLTTFKTSNSESGDWNHLKNPSELNIVIFPGKSNSFKLYEDDGASQNYVQGNYALTPIVVNWAKDKMEIRIDPVDVQNQYKSNNQINNQNQSNTSEYLPEMRTINIICRSILPPEERTGCDVNIDGEPCNVEINYDRITNSLELKNIQLNPGSQLRIIITNYDKRSLILNQSRIGENLKKLLKVMPISNSLKMFIDDKIPLLKEQSQNINLLLDPLEKIIRNIEYPIDTKLVLQKIFIGLTLGLITPNILDISTIRNQINSVLGKSELDIKTLTPIFWEIYHNCDFHHELFKMNEKQLRALIEISGLNF
ncbi:MAG: TIM-barrel domain-containing protein [Promethearchaeota archaeon]